MPRYVSNIRQLLAFFAPSHLFAAHRDVYALYRLLRGVQAALRAMAGSVTNRWIVLVFYLYMPCIWRREMHDRLSELAGVSVPSKLEADLMLLPPPLETSLLE